jgi:hypothetical protein
VSIIRVHSEEQAKFARAASEMKDVIGIRGRGFRSSQEITSKAAQHPNCCCLANGVCFAKPRNFLSENPQNLFVWSLFDKTRKQKQKQKWPPESLLGMCLTQEYEN